MIDRDMLTKYYKLLNCRTLATGNETTRKLKTIASVDKKGRRVALKGLNIFTSWYNYNFAPQPEQKTNDNTVALQSKGKKLMWIWSHSSSTGKTTVWKKGLQSIGQVGLEISFNRGWVEAFKPKSCSFIIIDGVTADTKSQGLSIQLIESWGQGFATEMPQRYVDPPKTSGEPVFFTSNSHPRTIYGKKKFDEVIETRMKIIQLRAPYLTGFDLTNLLRECNGLAPLGSPDEDSDAEADFGDEGDYKME